MKTQNKFTHRLGHKLRSIPLALLLPIVGIAVGYASEAFVVQDEGTAKDATEEITPTPLEPIGQPPALPLPNSVMPDIDSVQAAKPHKIDDSLRSHWVTLDKGGDLRGRISTIPSGVKAAIPLRELDVFLVQQGRTKKLVRTSLSGEFTMRNIEPGAYTLVASGDSGFLAYGIYVVPAAEDIDDASVSKPADHLLTGIKPSQPVSDTLQIDAAAVPPEFTTLRQITSKHLPADIGVSSASSKEGIVDIFNEDELLGDGFAFELTVDGSLVGKVQPVATRNGEPIDLEEMNVFLIQDDVEVAREPIEEDGSFEVPDLEPGVFSVVVAGEQGFAALSVQLIEAQSDVDASGGVYTNLATAEGPSVFSIGLTADPADAKFIRSVVLEEPIEELADTDDPAPPTDPGGGLEGFGPQGFGPEGYFEPFPEAPVTQSLPPINIPKTGLSPDLVKAIGTGGLLIGATYAAIEISDAANDEDIRPFPASPTSTQGQQ